MKNLILVNGTMGAGKTAVCRALLPLLQPSAFLDGDWCWASSPFIVSADTKRMVLKNIGLLLNNLLRCPAYETVVFCWVMHQQQILDDILSRLQLENARLFCFTLALSEQRLRQQLERDILSGLRAPDVVERSLAYLPLYDQMDTVKIRMDGKTAADAAEEIAALVRRDGR